MPDYRLRSLAVIGCLACLGAAGCGSPDSSLPEATGTTAQPVLDGHWAGATNPYVVVVQWAQVGCSGVAIAPDIVVTARHCVSNAPIGMELCQQQTGSYTPPQVLGSIPDTKIWIQFQAPADNTFIAPPKDEKNAVAYVKEIFAPQRLNPCYDDYVALLLDRDLPAWVKPPPIRGPDSPPLQIGDTVSVIGWGGTSTRPTYPNGPQAASGPIVAKGPTVFKIDPWPGQYVPEGNFLSKIQTCFGDSGGAVVSQKTGAVVGVQVVVLNPDPSTYQTKTSLEWFPWCKDSYSGAEDIQLMWNVIQQAFAKTKYVPWLEGRPKPSNFGGPCELDEDCNTRICITQTGAKTGVCSEPCDQNQCPSGYNCVPRSSGPSVCLAPRVPTAPGNDPQTGCSIGEPERDSGSSGLALLLALFLPLGMIRRRSRKEAG